jgi:hypothetical protein
MNVLKLVACCNAGLRSRGAGLALVLGVLAFSLTGVASAGCARYASPAGPAAPGAFSNAVFHPAGNGGYAFLPVGNGGSRHESMVGLWKIEFIAKGNTAIPDGALIDFGTAIWYSDGTETMVSGGRQPATGDVCMGAWKQTGHDSYALNHIALAYEGGVYVGPASIVELVTLDASGNSFSGSFTITQYLATAIPGHEFDENTILAPTPIRGTITGTRVTAN